ncbi:MAG: carbohydrate binding domain-containing protein [Treponema sp.]|nr:carbohydrate binding domain-containing protein [Treponema sp.]
MKKTAFVLMILISGALFAQGIRPAEGAFTFNVLDMAEDSPVSCRDLNKEITNESPRMVVDKDGHLSVGGERVRIFGTNLSAFPEKSMAERNARSLADRGFNCIRFHHTDADWVSCFIKKTSDGKRIIDPVQLDNFDYFVYMLKIYGIYTNLNLLTGRTYTEKDGMPEGTDRISDWKNRHLLGFWNDQARDLQKEYAKALLEHVNPYTGIPLKEDPALCIVEINNEQGMIHSYIANNFHDTPANLWNELEIKWNQWLKKQNLDYEKLSASYNRSQPLGNYLLDSKSRWNLEQHDGAKATRSGEGSSVKIKISGNGKAAWHVQYNSAGLNIEKDQIYTISFKAKASKPAKVSFALMMAHDPWENLGWVKNLNLDKEWQTYEFVVADLKSDQNARFNVGDMGYLEGTTLEIKDFTMREGGNLFNLKKTPNGVLLPEAGDYWSLPDGYKNLVLNFLYDVETDYWTDMRDYVKNVLGCPALIMGSAMGNITTGHAMLFDMVDSHSYFNHPEFPGNSWDQANFAVRNADLTKQENSRTLSYPAGLRVFGKPFCVSEYDHPYPNQFTAEMYPMLAAYASYQDWDAVFTFCSDLIESAEAKNRKISGYFDQTHNPVKTAASPVAARIFRTGAVSPADNYIWMNLDQKTERENLYRFRSWEVGNSSLWGFIPIMALGNRTGILWESSPDPLWKGCDSEKAASMTASLKENLKKSSAGLSGSGENSSVFWEEEKGTFLASGENAFVFVGRKDSPAMKKVLKDGSFSFEFVPSGDFASVSGVRKADGKWLVFAGSWSGNKGEQLREYGNPKPYSTSNDVIQRDDVKLTSKAPYSSKDAVTLSVSGLLKSLKGKMKLVPLSEKGLPSGKAQKGTEFELTEASGTLWYLIE